MVTSTISLTSFLLSIISSLIILGGMIIIVIRLRRIDECATVSAISNYHTARTLLKVSSQLRNLEKNLEKNEIKSEKKWDEKMNDVVKAVNQVNKQLTTLRQEQINAASTANSSGKEKSKGKSSGFGLW